MSFVGSPGQETSITSDLPAATMFLHIDILRLSLLTTAPGPRVPQQDQNTKATTTTTLPRPTTMAPSSSSPSPSPQHAPLSASNALRLILRPEVMALDTTNLLGTTWLSKTIHGLLEVWATTPSFRQQWAPWLGATLATDALRRAAAARIVAALKRQRPVFDVLRDGRAGLAAVRDAGSSAAGHVGCAYLAFHDFYDRDGVHAWRKVYAGATVDFRRRRRQHRVVRRRGRDAAAVGAKNGGDAGTQTQTQTQQIYGRKMFPIARVNGDGADDVRLRLLMGQWAIGMWDLYAYQPQQFPVDQ